jgi:hypothetical protein
MYNNLGGTPWSTSLHPSVPSQARLGTTDSDFIRTVKSTIQLEKKGRLK